MSAKLIMKRKRENAIRNKLPPTTEKTQSQECREPEIQLKRERLEDTVPETPPAPVSFTRNRILLEALQKIVELQNELDEFEDSLDAQEHSRHDCVEFTEESIQQEAHALGYAMCARETLTYLQRQGVPSDSLLYRTLQEKLTSQAGGVAPL